VRCTRCVQRTSCLCDGLKPAADPALLCSVCGAPGGDPSNPQATDRPRSARPSSRRNGSQVRSRPCASAARRGCGAARRGGSKSIVVLGLHAFSRGLAAPGPRRPSWSAGSTARAFRRTVPQELPRGSSARGAASWPVQQTLFRGCMHSRPQACNVRALSRAAGNTHRHRCLRCQHRTETCRFSGLRIYPGRGIKLARTDGQVGRSISARVGLLLALPCCAGP
jgi:hypothetical protein